MVTGCGEIGLHDVGPLPSQSLPKSPLPFYLTARKRKLLAQTATLKFVKVLFEKVYYAIDSM